MGAFYRSSNRSEVHSPPRPLHKVFHPGRERPRPSNARPRAQKRRSSGGTPILPPVRKNLSSKLLRPRRHQRRPPQPNRRHQAPHQDPHSLTIEKQHQRLNVSRTRRDFKIPSPNSGKSQQQRPRQRLPNAPHRGVKSRWHPPGVAGVTAI